MSSSSGERDARLKSRLQEKLSAAHVSLVDESDGCGSKYRCQVVSAAFSGKSRLECHRMVHEAVGEEDMAAIHAFSVKTFTPDKWEEQQKKN